MTLQNNLSAMSFRLFGYFPMTKINDTGDKFFAGVVDTAEQFYSFYSLANISVNFAKKFKTAPMEYLGAWGTLIHEKNLKSKISF